MPTYEYRCKECGDELEVVQSFTDDPLDTCPSCGGPLRKVFAAPGISFKGSGFYKTDSKSTSSSSVSSGSGDSATAGKDASSPSKDGGSSGGTDSSSSTGSSDSTSSSSGSSGSSGSSSGTKESTPA